MQKTPASKTCKNGFIFKRLCLMLSHPASIIAQLFLYSAHKIGCNSNMISNMVE